MKRYIHELADWPRLTWQRDGLAYRLACVLKKQGMLLGRVQGLGFDIAQAHLETLTQDVLQTSAIEGERLDPLAVRSSIARHLGIDIGVVLASDRQVEGVVEMLLDATGNCNEPLTADRLFGWHAALFPTGYSGMHKIRVANWREGEMVVASGPIGREHIHFEAPDAPRVPGEMVTFLEWLNHKHDGLYGRDYIEPVVKSALAHLWFVTIHPFDDGNGRIARAIADLMLARADGVPGRFYSMSNEIARRRASYYDILERTQKETLDVSNWVDWYLACLEGAIDNSEDLIQRVLRKARLWMRLGGVDVNDRQRDLLNRLCDQQFVGNLTSGKFAGMAKVSQPTAVRDLDALVDHGVLTRVGAGRGTHYTLAP